MSRHFASTWIVVSMAMLVGASSPARGGAWDKKATRAAAARAVEAFSETSFLARIPLERNVHYYVNPDGSPADVSARKQARNAGEGALPWDDGIKVGQGQEGAGLYVYAKRDQVILTLNRKRGATLNPTWIHIVYDRETTPADFDPYGIAEAAASLVTIRGFEPGSGVAGVLEEAAAEAEAEAAGAAASGSRLRQAGPTILALVVRAEPAQVRVGEIVRLILDYEVAGGSEGADVRETRTLLLDGEPLPAFPKGSDARREGGSYTSSYEQPIPSSASSGTYTFTGEVCVAGDCIQRSATFLVR